MSAAALPFILAGIIFLSSLVSIELGLSVTIIEILAGALLGNTLHPTAPEWMSFLASLGSIVLTFLAGAEVDPNILREKAKESFLIGFVSFLAPFVLAALYCYYIAGWNLNAALIGGVSLSTTSLAVVYAVLVETGLTNTEIGKIIMASCFVTDMGTVLALSLIFAQYSWWTPVFVAGSIVIIILLPKLLDFIKERYGSRVVQPDVKIILVALFGFMFLAQIGQGHAVLPAFIAGLVVSRFFSANSELPTRLRSMAFALLTPFFFIRAGMNVSVAALASQIGLLIMLFVVKVGAKCIGVYPLARVFVRRDAVYTTLLMSTGLTFGTISAMFGLSNGYIDNAQFSVLVTVVILSAIIPTFIAQKWFEPEAAEEETVDEHVM